MFGMHALLFQEDLNYLITFMTYLRSRCSIDFKYSISDVYLQPSCESVNAALGITMYEVLIWSPTTLSDTY